MAVDGDAWMRRLLDVVVVVLVAFATAARARVVVLARRSLSGWTLALAVVPAVALGVSPAHAAAGPLGQAGSWQPIFADEFDGAALDRSTWYPNRWFAASCSRGATPNELAYYTSRPANIAVSRGELRLIARRELFYLCGEASWAGTSGYTSGWVQTGGARASDGSVVPPGFTMATGYVEARIKLPVGKGLWPAVWMLSTHRDAAGKQQYPSRPEIDNLEVLGDSPEVWHHNVHFDGVDEGSAFRGPSSAAAWHTIGLRREADRITWYLDGQRTWTYAGPGIPDPSVRMYVILNLAVGGDWPGPPSAGTVMPATMLVDYVRAWQPAEAPATAPDTRPPSLRIIRPARRTVRGPAAVHASATDDRGVSRMELRIDGRLVRTSRTRSLRYRWTPRAARRYVLEVTAYDAARNRRRASRTVTVKKGRAGRTGRAGDR